MKIANDYNSNKISWKNCIPVYRKARYEKIHAIVSFRLDFLLNWFSNKRHWFKDSKKKPVENRFRWNLWTLILFYLHKMCCRFQKHSRAVCFGAFFYYSTVNINYLILHVSNCNHTISCIDLFSTVVINRIQIRHITGIMCNDIPKIDISTYTNKCHQARSQNHTWRLNGTC